jgi:hypothetical protein
MKIVLEKSENSVNTPTNYYIVTDNSGSMWSSIKNLKQTLLATKQLIGPHDTISLAWFSGYNSFDWITKGASLTTNFDQLIDQSIYSRGMTCYTQVLASLKDVVSNVTLLTGNSNSVLYFLSDGWPNSNSSESDILRLCRELNGKFTTTKIIGYSNNYNRKILLEMADALSGQMSHISDHIELDKSYKAFFENKAKIKNIALEKKFDLVWQVSNEINILTQKEDNSVDVQDTGEQSELFAINYDELNTLDSEILEEPKFVYSLAFALSQRNKANLGVALLRKAGDTGMASFLRKAFTVAQKGQIENDLKNLTVIASLVLQSVEVPKKTLTSFLEEIQTKIGNIAIDLDKSEYSSVTRSGTNISKVNFETESSHAYITQVISNENRANVSLLTTRMGVINGFIDEDLAERVEAFNETASKKIILPLTAPTYRNYTLVANGDFNFKKIVFSDGTQIEPKKELDLFEDSTNVVHIKDFVNLSKTLINEKAHASVLAFYIKQNSEQKHATDWRVEQYGVEGAKLLEEMGIDYAGRYAPKKESVPVAEDADYIPFLEIDGYIKGASTVSASTSFKKWEKGSKPNVADEIIFPMIEKYEALKGSLSKELFVKTLQTSLEGVQRTVRMLARELSAIKFYLVVTNSWFDGVDKADEFEYDGFVVKVKEVKEFL